MSLVICVRDIYKAGWVEMNTQDLNEAQQG